MNRRDLQVLCRLRRREAQALLRRDLPCGAYYFAGYAVECALKACIAKRTRRHDFPDRQLATSAYTHNLDRLLELAGLKRALGEEMKRNPGFAKSWRVVKDWNEAVRYSADCTQAMAVAMYVACTRRDDGVLPWIMKRW